MKLLCLDIDHCGEVYFLSNEDIRTFDLSKKFHKCSECSALAILVKHDFFLEEENTVQLILKLKKIKENVNNF